MTVGTSFDLAQAICNSRWDDVPPDVRHAGKRSLLNYFATALAGSADQAVHILVPFLSKYSSAADTIESSPPDTSTTLRGVFVMLRSLRLSRDQGNRPTKNGPHGGGPRGFMLRDNMHVPQGHAPCLPRFR